MEVDEVAILGRIGPPGPRRNIFTEVSGKKKKNSPPFPEAFLPNKTVCQSSLSCAKVAADSLGHHWLPLFVQAFPL